MASVPIDLSSYKPSAGNDLAAAKIANAMTAIESYTGSGLDMNALTQKGATIGQVAVWDGSKWTPGDGRYPMAPTILGPTAHGGTAAALVANQAYLVQVGGVVAPTTITRVGFALTSGGATGNSDVGVYYSDDDATFTRLVSAGSTVTPATNTKTITVASTTLTPVAGRRWYLAIACSSTTPTWGASSANFIPFGFFKTSSFPLPSSLTAMTAANVSMPTLYALV